MVQAIGLGAFDTARGSRPGEAMGEQISLGTLMSFANLTVMGMELPR